MRRQGTCSRCLVLALVLVLALSGCSLLRRKAAPFPSGGRAIVLGDLPLPEARLRIFGPIVVLEGAWGDPARPGEMALFAALMERRRLLRGLPGAGSGNPLLRREMDLLGQVHAVPGMTRQGVYMALADLYLASREDALAGDIYAWLLDRLDPEAPLLLRAGLLNNLSLARRRQGMDQEAIRLSAEALRRLGRALGRKDPLLLVPLLNLAALHERGGRNRRAEAFYRQGLEIIEAHGLEAGLNGAILCNNLGNLLRRLGRVDEALAMYRRALEMKDALLPPGHASRLKTLDNLAGLLKSQGRFEEAALALEAGCARLDMEPQEWNLRTWMLLADLLVRLERLDEAEGLYQKLFTLWDTAGRVRPEILEALGRLLLRQGRTAEAIRLYERLLACCLGGSEQQRNRAALHNLLGNIHRFRKECDQARRHYQQAERILLDLRPSPARALETVRANIEDTMDDCGHEQTARLAL